jgi:hypothetical protein
VTTAPNGDGRLRVTVDASSPVPTTPNQLVRLRFEGATNAHFDIGLELDKAVPFFVNLPAGTQQTTFYLRRVTPGQSSTLHLVITDNCGDWPTFVGGGPGAF